MPKISMRKRHVAFLTSNFPSPRHPNQGTFVRQFVNAVAECDVRCTVIHPLKVHEIVFGRLRRSFTQARENSGFAVQRPLFVSTSNINIGLFSTYRLTNALFRRSIWRALSRYRGEIDAVYGHFLYPAGAAAVWAGKRLDCSSFVAVGEGSLWTLRPLGLARACVDFARVTGAIAVSRVLRRRLVEEVGLPVERVKVFPNGVDRRQFYPRSRSEMRRKYNLPEHEFLAIFVGNFIPSKGIRRVAAAIDGMSGVAGLFVGSGPTAPACRNVVFCDRVEHACVPELLAAADCFVLPSDVEGSSNATLEAMACGLAVVVSDAEFNDDLVIDGCNGLRVAVDDTGAIRHAISRLRDDFDLRARLSKAALLTAEQYEIGARARSVIAWMADMASLGAAGVGEG